jgi:hypothetical protein
MYGLRHGIRRLSPSILHNDLRSVHSCNFAVWRDDFIRVNGFNEEFDESGLETIELATRLSNAGFGLRTITGQAIIYHLDHRYSARYRSLKTARILEHSQREKTSRCALGIAGINSPDVVVPMPDLLPSTPAAAMTRTPATKASDGAAEEHQRPSHFRDKIVPRSMLPRILPGGH